MKRLWGNGKMLATRITITKGDKYPRPYISRHRGNNSLILHRIFTKAGHLALLMNTSTKFKVNQTETVGGVVQTSIFKSNQGQ